MLLINFRLLNFKTTTVLAVGIFFSTASIVLGQSYYHSPNDTLKATTSVDNSVTLNITQVHSKNDTIIFKWSKLSVDIPSDWQATICDNNTCYPSLIDSATMIPAIPNENGMMLVHCTPSKVAGKAIIRYTIFANNSPEKVDTLTWIIEATNTVDVSKIEPANNLFSVNGNRLTLNKEAQLYKEVLMVDLSGKVQFRQAVEQQSEIQLPNLPPAIYLIELRNLTNVSQQKIWYSIEN